MVCFALVMPTNNPSTLESKIHEIVARAAAEIAATVRGDLAAEVQNLLQSMAIVPPARAPAPRPAVPAPRPAAPAQTTGKTAATKNKQVAKPKRGPKKGSKRRLISDAELNVVLDVLKDNPGLTSVGIQKAANIDSKQAARVLNKLRETNRVKWEGERAMATYTIA